MTAINTDRTTEYGVPHKEYHDEWEVDFHCSEGFDERLCSADEWAKRHADRTLNAYCDLHPSAPECRIYDD